MNEAEASEEVRVIGELFPRTNETMLNFLHGIFKQYDRAIVRKAIIEYAKGTDEFIDRTKLRAAIESLMGNGPKPESPADRIKEALAESAEWWKEIKAERDKAKFSTGQVNAALADFTDADLEDLKSAVIAEKPQLASLLRLSSIREGKALRYFMAEHVFKGAPS